MLREIIGDLQVLLDNHKFLAKFNSGTGTLITDPVRLLSLFRFLREHPLEFVLIERINRYT